MFLSNYAFTGIAISDEELSEIHLAVQTGYLEAIDRITRNRYYYFYKKNKNKKWRVSKIIEEKIKIEKEEKAKDKVKREYVKIPEETFHKIRNRLNASIMFIDKQSKTMNGVVRTFYNLYGDEASEEDYNDFEMKIEHAGRQAKMRYAHQSGGEDSKSVEEWFRKFFQTSVRVNRKR